MANNTKKDVGIAAALVAAAAGLYYLYGKDGVKHRKAAKSWMLRAKAEILERLEELDEITEGKYRSTVDDILRNYKQIKGIDKTELAAIALELQQSWKHIKHIIQNSKKTNRKNTSSPPSRPRRTRKSPTRKSA